MKVYIFLLLVKKRGLLIISYLCSLNLSLNYGIPNTNNFNTKFAPIRSISIFIFIYFITLHEIYFNIIVIWRNPHFILLFNIILIIIINIMPYIISIFIFLNLPKYVSIPTNYSYSKSFIFFTYIRIYRLKLFNFFKNILLNYININLY